MQQQGPTPDLLWTIPEIITASRSSRNTVYREINSGRLKTVKLGRRRYIRPEDARAWIADLMEVAD